MHDYSTMMESIDARRGFELTGSIGIGPRGGGFSGPSRAAASGTAGFIHRHLLAGARIKVRDKGRWNPTGETFHYLGPGRFPGHSPGRPQPCPPCRPSLTKAGQRPFKRYELAIT